MRRGKHSSLIDAVKARRRAEFAEASAKASGEVLPGNRFRHPIHGDCVVADLIPRDEDQDPAVVFQQLRPGGSSFTFWNGVSKVIPREGWERIGGGAVYQLGESEDRAKPPTVALGVLGLVAVAGVMYIAMRKPEPEA